jgi:hypothetical protein
MNRSKEAGIEYKTIVVLLVGFLSVPGGDARLETD